MILLAFFRPSSALRYESNRKKEVKKSPTWGDPPSPVAIKTRPRHRVSIERFSFSLFLEFVGASHD